MTNVLDEGSESAFIDNRLLATLPMDIRHSLRAQMEIVALQTGDVVLSRGADVDASLFPFGPTMVSMIVDLGEGRSVEVASIGREGAIGGIVSCGSAPAFGRAEVIVAGSAARLPMAAIEQAKSESPHLRNLFCRYSDYLLGQIMQSVACNSFHPIEQRAARWLLTAQDRAGDRLALTQEQLARLLGVQRTTLNAAQRLLTDEGLIATRRGAIAILDRAALEARACACYATVEDFFGNMVGLGGSGRAA